MMDPLSTILMGKLQAALLKGKVIPRLLGIPTSKKSESEDGHQNSISTTQDIGETGTGRKIAETTTPCFQEYEEDLTAMSRSGQAAQHLDAISEQELREEKYIAFNGEGEEDYTAGPARMIFAFDGVQECVTLLMKLDLSVKMQEAVKLQRNLAEKQSQAEDQVAVIEEFELKLREEIDNYDVRVAKAQEDNHSDQENVARSLKERLDVLLIMANIAELKKQRIHNNLEWQAKMSHEAQQELITYLEEVFVHANLIEPPHETVRASLGPLDLQEEYQKTLRELQEDSESDMDTPEALETGDTFMRPSLPSPSPEQQAEREVLSAVWVAKENLEKAQEQFDDRVKEQGKELALNQKAALQNGEPFDDTLQMDFDLR